MRSIALVQGTLRVWQQGAWVQLENSGWSPESIRTALDEAVSTPMPTSEAGS